MPEAFTSGINLSRRVQQILDILFCIQYQQIGNYMTDYKVRKRSILFFFMQYWITVVSCACLNQFYIVLFLPLQMVNFFLKRRHLPISVLFLLLNDLQPFRQSRNTLGTEFHIVTNLKKRHSGITQAKYISPCCLQRLVQPFP